tara:strand:- start:63 stop:167 length:105 start_codon:yes stop_codon:yes gene_type:complete
MNFVLFVGEKKQKKYVIADKMIVFDEKYLNWAEI